MLRLHAVDVKALHKHPGECGHEEVMHEDGHHRAQELQENVERSRRVTPKRGAKLRRKGQKKKRKIKDQDADTSKEKDEKEVCIISQMDLVLATHLGGWPATLPEVQKKGMIEVTGISNLIGNSTKPQHLQLIDFAMDKKGKNITNSYERAVNAR